MKGKRILVLGDPPFFKDGIGRHLAKANDVRYEEPRTIFSLAHHVARADLVWVEWAGKWCNLIGRLAVACPTVCRVHRGEIYEPRRITAHNWSSYDLVFFVSAHMQDSFRRYMAERSLPRETRVLYNGIDLDGFPFKTRAAGFNIAAVASMTFRKNAFMMAELMCMLVKRDARYNLRIVGPVDEGDCLEAFLSQCERSGLRDHVRYEGAIPHGRVSAWLEDKQYILSTSVHEGHPVALNEAMACGIKPVIYEYPGAREVFPAPVLYRHLDEAEAMICSAEYDSNAYRHWVASQFSIETQCNIIEEELGRLMDAPYRHSRWDFAVATLKTVFYRGSHRLRGLFDN